MQVLRGLSTDEKLKSFGEWKQSPWFGWAVLTLITLERQAENFLKMPPDGIKELCMREQAQGEINGLRRFKIECDEVLAALIEQKDEETKPKQESELDENN